MTPEARISAAIDILDQVLAGQAAERVLTNWARSNRYAGSKDRAALRDLVFDALRRLVSHAALGGAMSGRGVMIGALRAAGRDPAEIFSGARFAPAPLSDVEHAAGREPAAGAEALDWPDWLWPDLVADLGAAGAEAVAATSRGRAPVGIRANLARISRDALALRLAAAGFTVAPDPRSPSALVMEEAARGLQQLPEWQDGLFELQDAASQMVADLVPLEPGQCLLDLCAGGGGKTLAVAGRVRGQFLAHDVQAGRMADLPARAARAGVAVTLLRPGQKLPECDTVLVDAPCSGSGTWRRAPEAKWRLDAGELARLVTLQAGILDRAAAALRPGGHLVYATCSVLTRENGGQVAAFLGRHPGFRSVARVATLPGVTGDGFFCEVMLRTA